VKKTTRNKQQQTDNNGTYQNYNEPNTVKMTHKKPQKNREKTSNGKITNAKNIPEKKENEKDEKRNKSSGRRKKLHQKNQV
jgi:hypothetical protein